MKYPEIDRLVNRYSDLAACRNDIERAFSLLRESFNGGGLLLACGTGPGSATAEQLVAGLLRNFQRERPLPREIRTRLESDHGAAGERLAAGLHGALPAMALSGPGSLLSGIAAADPSHVYAQQVYGYGRAGDTLLVLATEGPDPMLLAALRLAGSMGMQRLVLAGRDPGELVGLADCTVRVPRVTGREISELHLPICNTLCTMLEQEFFS